MLDRFGITHLRHAHDPRPLRRRTPTRRTRPRARTRPRRPPPRRTALGARRAHQDHVRLELTSISATSTSPRSSSHTTSRTRRRSPARSASSSTASFSRSGTPPSSSPPRPIRSSRRFTGASLLPGTAIGRAGRSDGGHPRRRRHAWSTQPASGRVDLAVYPWDVTLAREQADRLGRQPPARADHLDRPDRRPRARARRPDRRRDHRRLSTTPRAHRRRHRDRLVQGDRNPPRLAVASRRRYRSTRHRDDAPRHWTEPIRAPVRTRARGGVRAAAAQHSAPLPSPASVAPQRPTRPEPPGARDVPRALSAYRLNVRRCRLVRPDSVAGAGESPCTGRDRGSGGPRASAACRRRTAAAVVSVVSRARRRAVSRAISEKPHK